MYYVNKLPEKVLRTLYFTKQFQIMQSSNVYFHDGYNHHVPEHKITRYQFDNASLSKFHYIICSKVHFIGIESV